MEYQTRHSRKERDVKKYTLAALLAAIVLTLTACGGSEGTSGGSGANGGGKSQNSMQGATREEGTTQKSEQVSRQETTGGEMARMEGMEGMDHGETTSEDMAAMSREIVAPKGKYSDRSFIDAMVPHHEGAVDMAQVALKRAEHPEIANLAEDIIGAQRSEIELFGKIRKREYGSAESKMEMNEQNMRAMGMSEPEKLANAEPFDKAFIDEMIPHHESAITMAEVALQNTDDPEIRGIAEDIVSAQQQEIEQMKRWRKQWYREG